MQIYRRITKHLDTVCIFNNGFVYVGPPPSRKQKIIKNVNFRSLFQLTKTKIWPNVSRIFLKSRNSDNRSSTNKESFGVFDQNAYQVSSKFCQSFRPLFLPKLPWKKSIVEPFGKHGCVIEKWVVFLEKLTKNSAESG